MAQSSQNMSTTAEEGGQTELEGSDAASDGALTLFEQANLITDTAGFRGFLQRGGCASLSYSIRFDRSSDDDETVHEHHALQVFVDPGSLRYITGSVSDVDRGLQGDSVDIQHPTIGLACGCGESFRNYV